MKHYDPARCNSSIYGARGMTVTAIILAAGKSTRMGSPKMLLPWGGVTIIEHTISVFAETGVNDILVVTGGTREPVELIVRGCQKNFPVYSVYNKDYETGDMLSSIQCGLRYLTEKSTSAAMIGLGDQPQIQAGSVRRIRDVYLQTRSPLVVPSFQMHRGHPWLVARSLWNELLGIKPSQTPRDFLNAHAADIQYVEIDTPSILADLDTPEDYRSSRP
jgi:molybdenum cofactor cytidylyltransferase